jgi:hypothetical protein
MLLLKSAHEGLALGDDLQVFVRTEWETWISSYLHDALATFEPSQMRRLVLVVGAENRPSAGVEDSEPYRRIRIASQEWRICIEAADEAGIKLAMKLDVPFVKLPPRAFDLDNARSAEKLLGLLRSLGPSGPRPIVQGLNGADDALTLSRSTASHLLVSGPGL